jgi:predicted nucleotidyltransferase
MDELRVLQDVVTRLERAGFPYMLTGSLAMNYYTEPRMTRDIDIVLELRAADATHVAELFRPEYYVSTEAVRDAMGHRSMFNIIHTESLIKVDFILRKEEPYRRVEFERRHGVRIDDMQVFLVSKEDLIISKAHWARDSRSEVQLRDVRNLLTTGYDRVYLERWVEELNLQAVIEDALS